MHADQRGGADGEEVAPWVAVIERLWDDPAFEAEHRRRAFSEAERWNGNALAERYDGFFSDLVRQARAE